MSIIKNPNKDYFEAYKSSLEDWAEDNEWITNTAKLVLQDHYVDGDSWGVPGHPTIVIFLVAYIMVLTNRQPPEGEQWDDLRLEYNRIKHTPEDCVK